MPFVGAHALPRFSNVCRVSVRLLGLAEHSNVMGKVLVSSYLRERGAWLVFRRTGIPKAGRARIAGGANTLGGLKF
jgi:hypothetical protein